MSDNEPKIGKRAGDEAAREERRVQVYRLRLGGGSFRAIAAKLNIPLGMAHSDYKAVLQRVIDLGNDTCEEHRQLELERLDIAVIGIMDQVQKGHLGAIDRLVSISKQRAALLGLNIPVKQILDLNNCTPEQALAILAAEAKTSGDSGS